MASGPHMQGGDMQARGQLLRVLGLAFGLAAVVGSVVGQGILRSPGVVAQATADPLIIAGLWIAGALITLLSAIAYAEMGAAIPRAGGDFAYAERAFGGRTGVFIGLTLVVSFISSQAMLCFVVGEFLFRLGVGGGAIGPGALGMSSLVLFVAINASGTRASGFAQIVLSSLKGVILLALVIALFSVPQAAQLPPDPEPLRAGWLPMGTAILMVMGAYGGWPNIVFYGEEMRDPGRQLPRAMLGGIALTGLLYLLVNLAMLHVMSPDEMAGSVFVAADAAGIVFGTNADLFLTVFGVLSVGAIANLLLMSGTRSIFALARAGILPRQLSLVGSNGTPYLALLAGAATSAILILTDSYNALQTMSVTMAQLPIVLVTLGVIVLRRKEPKLGRPYRAPFYPWSIVLALIINSALLVVFIVQDPFYSFAGLALVGALWAMFELALLRRGAAVHMPERLEEVP